MQSTSWEMLGWNKHKLESRFLGEISKASDMQMTQPWWQKAKKNYRPLDESEEGTGKVGLKFNIQKTKIMASSPITSWEIDCDVMETVTNFIFGGSKITADGDCSHETKRCLLLGRKIMTNLDSILKSKDITLPTKVRLVKAMVFPVVLYGCESWTIKKAEHLSIDAFELWCWRRLLRVPWTVTRSNPSILKEISPDYSLEGLMLKLKLQHFGHLMQRTDWNRPWCWESLKVGGKGDDRGWDGWMASLTQWTWAWVHPGSWSWTGRPSVLQFMGSKSRTWLSGRTELKFVRCKSQGPRHSTSWLGEHLTLAP